MYTVSCIVGPIRELQDPIDRSYIFYNLGLIFGAQRLS